MYDLLWQILVLFWSISQMGYGLESLSPPRQLTVETATVIEMSSAFAEKIASLFRSNALKSFASTQHFIEAHNAYYNLRLNERRTKRQSSSFILHLASRCDSRCHLSFERALIQLDSLAAYEIFEYEYVLVTIHQSLLSSILRHLDSVTKQPLVLAAAPLLPEVKIDASIQRRFSDATLHQTCQAFTIIVSPLSSEQIDAFLAVMDLFRATSFFSWESHFEELLSGRRSFGYVEILPSSPSKDSLCAVKSEAVLIDFLSSLPEVVWIEFRPKIRRTNSFIRGLLQSGDTKNTPYYRSHLLTGAGQIVGLVDSGIDVNSCFFKDDSRNVRFSSLSDIRIDKEHRKVISYIAYQDRFEDSEGHGTHVAGTLLGSIISTSNTAAVEDSNGWGRYKGVAYNSKVSFFDIGRSDNLEELFPPSDLRSNLFEPLYSTGARVITNSWGSPGNEYHTYEQQIDLFMWLHPDALVVFAAGNSGPARSSLNNECTSKNGLCVGSNLNEDLLHWSSLARSNATFNKDCLAPLSARGPTQDGRMKPDLMAPGNPVTSALGYASESGHCGIQTRYGTSMSTPVIAGAAAMIREYFMKGYYRYYYRCCSNHSYEALNSNSSSAGFVPSGALVKAMLIHSGQRLLHTIQSGARKVPLQEYPSVDQGYGRAELDQVLLLSFASASASTSSPQLTLFVKGAAFPPVDSDSSQEENYYAAIHDIDQRDEYLFFYTEPETASTKQQQQQQQFPIRITVAFTDYPGATGSAAAAVKQNILSVTATVNRSISKNQSNADASTDAASVAGVVFHPYIGEENVLVIDIPASDLHCLLPLTCSINVSVTATQLLRSPQPYAIVATGAATTARPAYFLSGSEDIAASESPVPTPTAIPSTSTAVAVASSNSHSISFHLDGSVALTGSTGLLALAPALPSAASAAVILVQAVSIDVVFLGARDASSDSPAFAYAYSTDFTVLFKDAAAGPELSAGLYQLGGSSADLDGINFVSQPCRLNGAYGGDKEDADIVMDSCWRPWSSGYSNDIGTRLRGTFLLPMPLPASAVRAYLGMNCLYSAYYSGNVSFHCTSSPSSVDPISLQPTTSSTAAGTAESTASVTQLPSQRESFNEQLLMSFTISVVVRNMTSMSLTEKGRLFFLKAVAAVMDVPTANLAISNVTWYNSHRQSLNLLHVGLYSMKIVVDVSLLEISSSMNATPEHARLTQLLQSSAGSGHFHATLRGSNISDWSTAFVDNQGISYSNLLVYSSRLQPATAVPSGPADSIASSQPSSLVLDSNQSMSSSPPISRDLLVIIIAASSAALFVSIAVVVGRSFCYSSGSCISTDKTSGVEMQEDGDNMIQKDMEKVDPQQHVTIEVGMIIDNIQDN